ncbi:MAG: methyltransferase domain-containing protein [bacterium]
MRYSHPIQLIRSAKNARYIPKHEFIRLHVKDRDVLDLGCVAHSLSFCLNFPHRWLHNTIRSHARSALGVDLLEKEITELQKMGYNVIYGDAQTLRLGRKFDVVVCGDLIEHVANPAALLDTMACHIQDDGIAIVTTPNPFAITRFFNILADGWTAINTEHTFWICPQTMFQLVDRSRLCVADFSWLKTDFPMLTTHRFWGPLLNSIAPRIANKNQLFRNDYGVVLRKR